MSDTVISVEGLGKCYQIRHEQKQKYQTLREAILRKISSFGRPTPKAAASKEDFWALKDVSFEIKRGECVGIIGRNGAGKSTLLKILSRITDPTKGRIELHGRVASLLEVGTGFHPELTGRENIYLNGTILGMTKKEIDRKFDEIVAFAEIEKFLDTPVKHYSSGMYVRLAFAVAAHLEPEILVVDEVLAVGDAAFQKKCLGKMGDVVKEGRTVLFVSHNMAAVQQLCTKGIVLFDGKMTYFGTVSDAVDKYINMSNKLMEYDADGFIDLANARTKLYQDKVFKRVRMLDKDGVPCETFSMLSSIMIEVELDHTEKYLKADYGVMIFLSNGQHLTSFATWMYPEKERVLPRKMVLIIPSIKFSPGMYRVDLSMTYHSLGERIGKVENAINFYVESADIFNSGKSFTADYGLIVPDGSLQLVR